MGKTITTFTMTKYDALDWQIIKESIRQAKKQLEVLEIKRSKMLREDKLTLDDLEDLHMI